MSNATATPSSVIPSVSETNPEISHRSHSNASIDSDTSAHKRRKKMKGFQCIKCLKQCRLRCRGQPKRKPSIVSSSPEDASTQAMVQRLLNPDYSSIRKITWCLVAVVCTCVCLWQLGDRIKHYLDEPIMYQVTVERQHEVQFPAITLCPAREPFNDPRWEDDSLVSPANFSLEDVWSQYEIKLNDTVYIYAACNADHSLCDFDKGVLTKLNTTTSPTFHGNCLTLIPGKPMEFRGPSSFVELGFDRGIPHRQWFGQDIAAQFYFQDPNSRHRHEAYYLVEWLKLHEETYVHLSLKQFNFLNSTKNYCDNEAAVTDCRNKCVDTMLDEVVNCSLPFMDSKWPSCNTVLDAKRSMAQILQFYQKFSYAQCPCRRQCIEKVYSYNINSAGQRKDRYTTLLLQFSDNLVENVTEIYAYSFSALVSDIGGGLGFFLGVSILSLFRAFESILDSLNMKKTGRRASSMHVVPS